MKAISLWQPWASAISLGLKTIETRSWRTNYLGPIAIHAARKCSLLQQDAFDSFMGTLPEFHAAFQAQGINQFSDLPFGAIVATGEIDMTGDIGWFNTSEVERALGDYSPGRFGWRIIKVKRLATPVPCIGHQGFFNVEL